MPASFLEIVELADGEVVLQRTGADGEPLIQLKFSEEALGYLNENHLDIAKAMIQAGVQMIGLVELDGAELDFEDGADTRVLH